LNQGLRRRLDRRIADLLELQKNVSGRLFSDQPLQERGVIKHQIAQRLQ
jgi:hypothetical protein